VLGNFWFTYGIWPRSWMAFVFFGLANITINLVMKTVLKENE
jgi:hypothetical protein